MQGMEGMGRMEGWEDVRDEKDGEREGGM
jgi:hypothetical protein